VNPEMCKATKERPHVLSSDFNHKSNTGTITKVHEDLLSSSRAVSCTQMVIKIWQSQYAKSCQLFLWTSQKLAVTLSESKIKKKQHYNNNGIITRL